MELWLDDLCVKKESEDDRKWIKKLRHEESKKYQRVIQRKVLGDQEKQSYTCFVEDKLIGIISFVKEQERDNMIYLDSFFLEDKYHKSGYEKHITNVLCRYFSEDNVEFMRVSLDFQNRKEVRFWYQLGFDKITDIPFNAGDSIENFTVIELERRIYR